MKISSCINNFLRLLCPERQKLLANDNLTRLSFVIDNNEDFIDDLQEGLQ